ncbi:MAG: response regulator transcription factor [Bacilli bacterium]
MSILIYDDNKTNLKIMENTLQNAGYEVESSNDVIESIKLLEKNSDNIDLIITNYAINKFTLRDYLYIIRKLNKDIRVVVVSNSYDSKDELESIELCVDEYIKKPISTTILQKRVEMLYDSQNKEGHFFIKRDLITIDTINHIVKKRDKIVELSMTEYKILVNLVRNSNYIVSRKELYEKVWSLKYDQVKVRTVDVHISNLRAKLNLNCLYSVRGIGYRIEN